MLKILHSHGFDLIGYYIRNEFAYFGSGLTFSKLIIGEIIIVLVFVLLNRIKIQKPKNLIFWIALDAYMLLLFSITLLGRNTIERDISIKGILATFFWLKEDFYHAKFDVLFNIILFVPAGIFFKILFERKAIIMVCMMSILIETFQFLTALGQVEIGDVIFNTIGGIIGLIVCKFIQFLCD